MTERGFAEILHDHGFTSETHKQLTWEQVDDECKLIDAKKSFLSAEARKVFLVLRGMKTSKLRLPDYIQPSPTFLEEPAKKADEPITEDAPETTVSPIVEVEAPDVQE